jgi:hypothetical protein
MRAQMVNTPRCRSCRPALEAQELQLTPQERYLLSRIDGIRDIKAIIRVSPIRELEALKCFVAFVGQGLVNIA